MDYLKIALATSITLVIWFLLLLAARRLIWWYWGIDRMVRATEDIALSLRFLPGREKHDLQKRIQRQRAA